MKSSVAKTLMATTIATFLVASTSWAGSYLNSRIGGATSHINNQMKTQGEFTGQVAHPIGLAKYRQYRTQPQALERADMAAFEEGKRQPGRMERSDRNL